MPVGVAAPDPENPIVPPSLGSIIAVATQDAAARLNVDPATIELVRAYSVSWSDGSLGCPSPDLQYMQALEPVLVEDRI